MSLLATTTTGCSESTPLTEDPRLWAGFMAFVLVAMVVDLGLHKGKKRGRMSTRDALGWFAAWTTMAFVFAGVVWQTMGLQKAEEFLAGYVLEKSLSVDNLFVFVLIFSAFKTPAEEQHRVLTWGIVGAMLLRAVMILAGAALIERFEWVMLLFAAILLWSGIKLLRKGEDEESDPTQSWIVRAARRVLPITDGYRGRHFFVREPDAPGGPPRLKATLLFLVLITVEFSDVLFAVDSIPAIFGITHDPFIVFTSNIFAILGLRSLFFVIEAAIQRLRYLDRGLALVLCFIAVKMCLPFLARVLRAVGVEADVPLLGPDLHVPIGLSLGVIAATLGVTTALSLRKEGRSTPRTGRHLTSHGVRRARVRELRPSDRLSR